MSATDFFGSLAYFGALSADEMARIAGAANCIRFDRGEVIFLEGEPCRGLYVVRSGQVRILKTSTGGREQVLFVAGPGDTFNEVPLFDGLPNPASATAAESSDVYLVPGEAVISLLAGCAAAPAMMRALAGRARHLVEVVEGLSFRSVLGRLSRLLLDMAVAEEARSPIPRLTQDEMASMVGSVRDVISRSLKTLEREGAIEIRGHRILVTDTRKLSEMTGA